MNIGVAWGIRVSNTRRGHVAGEETEGMRSNGYCFSSAKHHFCMLKNGEGMLSWFRTPSRASSLLITWNINNMNTLKHADNSYLWQLQVSKKLVVFYTKAENRPIMYQ